MKYLPYYAMYPIDFDEDKHVLPMSLSEAGLYILALNEAWKRGSIPDDPKALALAIRRDPKEVKKAWTAVSSLWVGNGEPGRLVNPRQEKERKKALAKSEQATSAARTRHADKVRPHVRPHNSGKGSASAPACANGVTEIDAFDVLRASDSDSFEVLPLVGSGAGSKKAGLPLPKGWHQDYLYSEFRMACGWLGLIESDFTEAWWEWQRLDAGQKIEALAGVKSLEASGADPNLVKRPKRYLKDHEWQRKPVARGGPIPNYGDPKRYEFGE